MPLKLEKIRDTMFHRPDPLIFRGAAYVVAVGVVLTDGILGGAWSAVLAAIMLVAAASFIFPARAPTDKLRMAILASLHAVRRFPWSMRLGCVVAMVVGASALDHYTSGFQLGRDFNVCLIPIFLAALLFELRLAILTWLFSLLLVYYLVIPPAGSFELGSLKDFGDLIGFFYLGLFALVIPVLIRASSAVSEGR